MHESVPISLKEKEFYKARWPEGVYELLRINIVCEDFEGHYNGHPCPYPSSALCKSQEVNYSSTTTKPLCYSVETQIMSFLLFFFGQNWSAVRGPRKPSYYCFPDKDDKRLHDGRAASQANWTWWFTPLEDTFSTVVLHQNLVLNGSRLWKIHLALWLLCGVLERAFLHSLAGVFPMTPIPKTRWNQGFKSVFSSFSCNTSTRYNRWGKFFWSFHHCVFWDVLPLCFRRERWEGQFVIEQPFIWLSYSVEPAHS